MGGKLPPFAVSQPFHLGKWAPSAQKKRPLDKTGNLFLISFSVGFSPSAILLSVIGVLYYCHYGNRPRWLMCLSMYTSQRRRRLWMTPNLHEAGLPFWLGGKWEPAFFLFISHLWLIRPSGASHAFALWLTDTRRNNSPTSSSFSNSYKDVFRRHGGWRLDRPAFGLNGQTDVCARGFGCSETQEVTDETAETSLLFESVNKNREQLQNPVDFILEDAYTMSQEMKRL